ncbi:glycosyl hydrolase family 18 protein [Pseudoneobacillus rhizosphaerae]|uniref:Sporulation-specific glycosylase YdhD n=1 Tax=Pseudoneobacillus rhizosphaerae TaxID=2880968 RepID=A0A9C7L9I8_9BACI|nr:glycosyl hydrolase family 18 protein [Pseudoneobacillus rhizosphaerae]CAG9606480.1 Putative sporulation-specific glycosylase YdhD [Pseudoneobacillus rhizosphaerae]
MYVHVVSSGDTLWAISNLYRVSIPSILSLNGLTSSEIVPGIALYIPTTNLALRFYRISPGDSLGQIASNFQINANDLLLANPGIHPNQLIIGQKITIPSPNKMTIQTLGFIVPYSSSKLLPTLRKLAKNITYLAVVSYSFTDEGWAYVQLDDAEIVLESKRLGMKPLLMIRNYSNEAFSPELVGRVFENPIYRANLVNSITNLVQQKGYEGVSIDFEFVPPPRRNDFNTFLSDLKRALGNRILQVNVHAKTEDIPTNRIIGAYDYKAIGEIADIVGVMTIDYGYPTGPPNPVSPIWWVEQVVQYSIQLIPPSKLQISIAMYGYDWRLIDNVTTAKSNLNAQNSAISNKVSIQYDDYAAVPWYRYWIGTEEHIVWFGDIRSVIEKYKLIDYYQLLGTTYWHIGLDFPQNWAYLEGNVHVVKPLRIS